MQKKQLIGCEHDELSENNIFNQIIKATSSLLIRESAVSAKCKAELKKEMLLLILKLYVNLLLKLMSLYLMILK